MPSALILETSSYLLLEDGTSHLLLEASQPANTEPYIVDPGIMHQFFADIESFVPAAKIQGFFVGFKQNN